jgi:hypothetical protein
LTEAVSRRLPTAAARVRSQVRSYGTGAGFLRVLRFPLPILIPPTSPYSSSSIIRGWYNRTTVADVPSGLSLTPPRELNFKNPQFHYRAHKIVQLLQITVTRSLVRGTLGIHARCPLGLVLSQPLHRAEDRALPQAVSRRLPAEETRVRSQVWSCDRFPPGTSVSPANSHSNKCSTLIYYPGLVQ